MDRHHDYRFHIGYMLLGFDVLTAALFFAWPGVMVGLSREKLNMMRDLRGAAILFFPLLLASQSASAATAAGSSALALASLVAAASPLLSRHEKRVMARLFGGHLHHLPANSKISVK